MAEYQRLCYCTSSFYGGTRHIFDPDRCQLVLKWELPFPRVIMLKWYWIQRLESCPLRHKKNYEIDDDWDWGGSVA